MVIRKIFEIFLLIVITEGCCLDTDYPEIEERYVDLGGNITVPCNESPEDGVSINGNKVTWIRKGREDKQRDRTIILQNGSLVLEKVERDDAGEYLCLLDGTPIPPDGDEIHSVEFEDDIVRSRFKLFVRTPPPALVNVSVHPSTVLALLLWEVGDTGGYDISYFSAQYRLKNGDPPDEWHDVLQKHISPNARQIDVYRLNPNSTYTFRIWANNHLGDGEVTQIDGTTRHVPEEIELARHLLEGAENFDTRVWVVAVAVVMGTLVMLSAGTCYLLCKEYSMPPPSKDDQEVIELVPNIILNPGFYDADLQTERVHQLDENCNDRRQIRLNNNSVVHPIRL